MRHLMAKVMQGETIVFTYGKVLMMMVQEIDRIAVGTRFKMSELGANRCRELAGQTGVVVDVSPRTTGVTVLFDGAKRSTCLHRDFISPIAGNGSWFR